MKNEAKSPHDSLSDVAKKILEPYTKQFLETLPEVLFSLGPDSRLKEAITYAMTVGGKRLRPAIVFMMAKALKKEKDVRIPAVIVEMFHVSSLISDDLPCMDNDDFRRGKPTTHKVFSESTALLASFALTSAGFLLLSRIRGCPEDPLMDEKILRTAVSAAGDAIGLTGLVGGQQFDLEPKDLFTQKSPHDAIMTIIDQKTGALFVLSFLLGFLYGGGDMRKIDQVKSMAIHFGRAFQILDDIDDLEQDRQSGKMINYALTFGLDAAKKAVLESLDSFIQMYHDVQLESSGLLLLTSAMREVVK